MIKLPYLVNPLRFFIFPLKTAERLASQALQPRRISLQR